ncbi:hypothetical protein DFP94_1011024 [Fontibacillus phaseoli]|uniref:Uncharacterized protein n=1 Tax=Fontibacillus phaseoli TaxID=1416533 RepID=A0A369BQU8_9BACL|nr:hypothetical protein DFP94_1011024 [Fontibacillus phaseoli]
MIWIGILFLVIMLFEWRNQSGGRAKRRDRWAVLAISVCCLLLSEVLFLLKNKWNLPILFSFLSKWIFGGS